MEDEEGSAVVAVAAAAAAMEVVTAVVAEEFWIWQLFVLTLDLVCGVGALERNE